MTALAPLTTRQREIVAFISAHVAQHGYAPTMREIGDHFGIASTNGVNDHLRALQRKGAIKRGPKGASRTITVVPGALS